MTRTSGPETANAADRCHHEPAQRTYIGLAGGSAPSTPAQRYGGAAPVQHPRSIRRRPRVACGPDHDGPAIRPPASTVALVPRRWRPALNGPARPQEPGGCAPRQPSTPNAKEACSARRYKPQRVADGLTITRTVALSGATSRCDHPPTPRSPPKSRVESPRHRLRHTHTDARLDGSVFPAGHVQGHIQS